MNPQQQIYLAKYKRNQRASILFAWMALGSFLVGIGFIFLSLPIPTMVCFFVTILAAFLAHELGCIAQFFHTISRVNKERDYQ